MVMSSWLWTVEGGEYLRWAVLGIVRQVGLLRTTTLVYTYFQVKTNIVIWHCEKDGSGQWTPAPGSPPLPHKIWPPPLGCAYCSPWLPLFRVFPRRSAWVRSWVSCQKGCCRWQAYISEANQMPACLVRDVFGDFRTWVWRARCWWLPLQTVPPWYCWQSVLNRRSSWRRMSFSGVTVREPLPWLLSTSASMLGYLTGDEPDLAFPAAVPPVTWLQHCQLLTELHHTNYSNSYHSLRGNKPKPYSKEVRERLCIRRNKRILCWNWLTLKSR